MLYFELESLGYLVKKLKTMSEQTNAIMDKFWKSRGGDDSFNESIILKARTSKDFSLDSFVNQPLRKQASLSGKRSGNPEKVYYALSK